MSQTLFQMQILPGLPHIWIQETFLSEESAQLEEFDPNTNFSDIWETTDHRWGIWLCDISEQKAENKKLWQNSGRKAQLETCKHRNPRLSIWKDGINVAFRFTDLNSEGTTRWLNLAFFKEIFSAAWNPLSVSCFGAGGRGVLTLASTKYKTITGNSFLLANCSRPA